MPLFLWTSVFLVCLYIIPRQCFSTFALLPHHKIRPDPQFNENLPPPVHIDLNKDLSKQNSLWKFLRAVSSIEPTSNQRQQHLTQKNSPILLLTTEEQDVGTLKKQLEILLDYYPKGKGSLYLENLSSLTKINGRPNELQKRLKWLEKSDNQEQRTRDTVEPIENQNYNKQYVKEKQEAKSNNNRIERKILEELIDQYPADKESMYFQDLRPLSKGTTHPNQLQESLGWLDTSLQKKKSEELGNKPIRIWNPSSRFKIQSKRSMENCKPEKQTVCFDYYKYPAGWGYPYYSYYPYYYPVSYYSYYPYAYWGRR